MPSLQKEIIDQFLQKLAGSDAWDANKLAELRKLFDAEKAPKSEDFARVFSTPAGGDIE